MHGMAKVSIENDAVAIDLSLLDKVLAFHGSLRIPLAHITNAYVSPFADLELRFKLIGTGLGIIKEAGIFSNPSGLIFCDVSGGKDSLVLDTRGERFPMIAVTLDDDADPNEMAHQIMAAIPDSGPSV
jgi:hypothetical protein